MADSLTHGRREYLKWAGGTVTASSIGLAGCLASSDATGTLATQVTDQPGDIADFESCVVTIEGIWVKRREDTDDEDDTGGDHSEDGIDEQDSDDIDQGEDRQYHEFDAPQEADLVELQGENTQLIDERDLSAGEYEFLQLDVSDVAGVLADGGDATVSTPGRAPLQFNQRFEIRDSEQTTFVADFTPVRRGRTNEYVLQPVADGTKVIYESEESD
ncbi:DUF4382 domain-containing protein [Halobiforma nitratireducens]|uniref:DUF4382 domain-containing protein n=1 Tax=Halobiforma nitratireducens JCM 10879 TaxID=1227454 RepID=M0M0E7_9EURY|nr:DUF4382 domain-containing protein [Halobiforma nitratireducens]EMA39146.1 hypothetical protein C446_08881 [Halobiforma nitratireducens JCM 10879]